MINCYKHLPDTESGFDTAVLSDSFKLNERESRKLQFQLIRTHNDTPLIDHSYYARIQEQWNNLPHSGRS